MKNNFNVTISVNPTITVGDVSGNVGLVSVAMVLVFVIVIVIALFKMK